MDINTAIKHVVHQYRIIVQKNAWEYIDVDTLYTFRPLEIEVEGEAFHVVGDSDKYFVMVRKSSMDNDIVMFGKVENGNLEKTVEKDVKNFGLLILAIRHIDDDEYTDNMLNNRREELLDQLRNCIGNEKFRLPDGTTFTIEELKKNIA